jgi:hypothetical protein
METINLEAVESTLSNEEHDRSQRTRMQLDQMISTLESMEVSFSLTWLYVWDVMKYRYGSMSEDNGFHKANPEFTIDDVWNALWRDPRFTLEYGIEQLYDEISDWLIEKGFILDDEDMEEEDE